MRSAGVRVSIDLHAAAPAISGNRGKLQQVLVNLMLNARDALVETPHPALVLRTSLAGGQAEIEVSDNDAGMPPEVLRKIYDPFFTTKAQPKEGQRKGTGLGLAVSYGIMQEHGGSMEADSVVGRGTTFRLMFPLLEGGRERGAAPLPLTGAAPATSSRPEGSIVHA